MNQIPLQDDVDFWSQQLEEHALFLHLLLQEPTLRRQALALYRIWRRARATGGDVLVPLSEIIAFKRMVLARMSQGEWLGWALPSFVQHILMEAEYFRSRLEPQGTTAAGDLQTWLQITKDHADVGPKLIDPAANVPLATQAQSLSNQIAQLQQRCSSKIDHSCLNDADKAMQTAATWVRSVPPSLSIVNPTLAAHILREQDRGVQVVQILSR
jgi:hypothetical protein